MPEYMFEDGDLETDVVFKISNVKKDDCGPYVDMDLTIETKDFSYHKSVSIDDYELKDLADTITRFHNGEMKEYYEWDHTEGDIEIQFDPQMGQITIKTFFNPSTLHMSGFFFNLYDEENYMEFYSFVINVLRYIGFTDVELC